MLKKKKLKGLYIVSEASTLIKGSGAFRHIEVGIEYLSHHFDIEFYSPSQETNIHVELEKVNKKKKTKENKIKKLLKKSGIWHTVKDINILIYNHLSIYKNYKLIKNIAPDFIYERSNFLDFQGLLISKWLKIPHFYENNGIKYLEHQESVRTWLNGIWAYLERRAYILSSFVFFVGLWGNKMNLHTKNWMNSENGIEEDFILRFECHKKEIKNKINICFIGSLMNHHGFYFLIQALAEMDTSIIHLHLIGSKMEKLVTTLSPIVETTYHGFLDREQLAEVLYEMHIGIIPGGKDYPSFMKLFDYGASKCLVIAPSLKNLLYWFNEDEIEFFEKYNKTSLVDTLERVILDYSSYSYKGEKLFNRINQDYTWTRIFERKANIISKIISENEKAY